MGGADTNSAVPWLGQDPLVPRYLPRLCLAQ